MEGKDELAAHAAGKLPVRLLPLSAMIASFGNALACPQVSGRAPCSALSVSVINLRHMSHRAISICFSLSAS